MNVEESEYFRIKYDWPVISTETHREIQISVEDWQEEWKKFHKCAVKSTLDVLDKNPRSVVQSWKEIMEGEILVEPMRKAIASIENISHPVNIYHQYVHFSQLGWDPRKKQISIDAHVKDGDNNSKCTKLFLLVEKKEKIKSLQELAALSVIGQLKEDIDLKIEKLGMPKTLKQVIKKIDEDDWRPRSTRAEDNNRVRVWLRDFYLLKKQILPFHESNWNYLKGGLNELTLINSK